MNGKTIRVVMAVAMVVALAAVDAMAAGGNGFGRMNRSMQANGTCVRSATGTRPEGSQRRDGTFLKTGVTANGSTTRPGYGKGVQDGSRLTTTPTTAPATTTDSAAQ